MTPTSPPPGRFRSWENWVRAMNREWRRSTPDEWQDTLFAMTDEQRECITADFRRRCLWGRP